MVFTDDAGETIREGRKRRVVRCTFIKIALNSTLSSRGGRTTRGRE